MRRANRCYPFEKPDSLFRDQRIGITIVLSATMRDGRTVGPRVDNSRERVRDRGVHRNVSETWNAWSCCTAIVVCRVHTVPATEYAAEHNQEA